MKRLLFVAVVLLSFSPVFAADYFDSDPLVFGPTKRDRQFIYQQQQMERMRQQQEDFERERQRRERYERIENLIQQDEQRRDFERMLRRQELERSLGRE